MWGFSLIRKWGSSWEWFLVWDIGIFRHILYRLIRVMQLGLVICALYSKFLSGHLQHPWPTIWNFNHQFVFAWSNHAVFSHALLFWFWNCFPILCDFGFYHTVDICWSPDIVFWIMYLDTVLDLSAWFFNTTSNYTGIHFSNPYLTQNTKSVKSQVCRIYSFSVSVVDSRCSVQYGIIRIIIPLHFVNMTLTNSALCKYIWIYKRNYAFHIILGKSI